jgi:glucose/arabinose dehydrogenase
MATAPDGRIFVNELNTGNIRVVTPTATLPWLLQAAPFAHLDVETGSEKGLLGIAVDPNFIVNHYVYVYYTASGPINRVVRYTATTSGGDTVATPGLPSVIVDNLPAANGHNGGIIHFGPDGMLYIFVGENEVADDAQDLNSRRGKILRFTPDGTIPSDNPFPSSAIYSYGHRNSFGFTFHPHTNDLWETENGATDNDQINRIIAGGNYGWPLCTGICGDPLWIDPIITFTPTIAPTGIVAIREDSVYPAQYHNNLLFADFNGGTLHRIVLGGVGLTDLSSHTIACNCEKGGLLAVMHGLNVPGQDGYI